jgi:hypothetical protein
VYRTLFLYNNLTLIIFKIEALQREAALENEKEKEEAVPSTPSVQMIETTVVKRDNTDLIFKLKSNEIHLRSEITRLKREIDRNNQTWEKKFEILKQK